MDRAEAGSEVTTAPLTRQMLLLAAALLVYAQAPFGPLQFDDYATLAVDPAAQSVSAWWAGAFGHVRPLTKLSFAITRGIGAMLGNVTLVHHLGSIAIHVLVVLALYRLLRELFSIWLPEPQRGLVERGAFVAALIFAVHPLATEAVTYLSGRSMALGMLLVILGLKAWIRRRPVVCVLVFALAVFCRETMIFAVLLVAVIEWGRTDHASAPFSTVRLRQLAPVLLSTLAGGMLAAGWLFAHGRYGSLLELSARIATDRFGSASLLVALHYFFDSLLLLRYPNIDPDVTPFLAMLDRVVLAALTAATLLLAWRLRRARPEFILGIAWIGVFIVPLYFVQVRHDAIAERHFYPALAGAAIIAGVLLARLRRVGALSGALLVLAFAGVTLVRNADYRSEVALWEAAARGSSEKLRVLNNLGAAYLEAGRWSDAEAVLERAIEIAPGHERVTENLFQARERRLR